MNRVLTSCLLLLAGCAGSPAASQAPDPGAPLQLVDTDGQAYDLDQRLAAGENVALVFWQTWCESCAGEAAAIRKAATVHGETIAFLGVVPGRDQTVDDAEVEETRQAWGYAFPQVRDRDMSLTRTFEVDGTPTIVVLGPGREVLFRSHQPPPDWGLYASSPSAQCAGGVCPLPE